MKAGSKFLNAVSAVALSASMVATGSGIVTLASASVAEAATISRVEVRGATRVSPGNGACKHHDRSRQGLQQQRYRFFRQAPLFHRLFLRCQHQYLGRYTCRHRERRTSWSTRSFSTATARSRTKSWRPSCARVSLGPYSEATAESDIRAIKEAYAGIGREDVTVTTQGRSDRRRPRQSRFRHQ